MKRKLPHFFIHILIIYVLMMVILGFYVFRDISFVYGKPSENAGFDYKPLIEAINMSAVKEHIGFFSSLGTRATGYVGNEIAAQYIYEKFLEYGLENVSYQTFTVVDCISYGANITILPSGEWIEIHPLVPNLVCPSTTPPEGITGKIVYIGAGDIKDFDGKDIDGNIVLMDWNSGTNWLRAAQLGAKAVIFLPPKYFVGSLYGRTHTGTNPSPVTKFLWDIPLNFPRFYVEEKGASLLLEASEKGLEIRLVSTQRWTKLTGKNVIGFIRGGERPDGIIVLTSYYDSYSIVPTLAPGAQESIGISTLLELAKYFSQRAREGYKPPVTLMFVAFGGHHQSLAGAISFATEYFFFPPEHIERREVGGRCWRLINLDLSTGSSVLYLTYRGIFFKQSTAKNEAYVQLGIFGDEIAKYQITLEQYIKEIQQQFPGKYEIEAWIGKVRGEDLAAIGETNRRPTKIVPFDSEVCHYIGPYSFTITTAYDFRPYFWTPFDTIDKINWKNLEKLLQSTYAILIRSIYNCLNEYRSWYGRDPIFKFYRKPEGIFEKDSWNFDDQTWSTIYGKVAIYDEETAFWKPLTKSYLGNLTAVVYLRGIPGVMERRFTIAEEDGSFSFTGALTSQVGVSRRYKITAWVIDPNTGNVVFAPDMGPRAFPMPTELVTSTTPYSDVGFVTVFNASTLAILDLIFPNTLGVPELETPQATIRAPPELTVFEAEKYVPPNSYGVWYESDMPWISLVAFPPNTPVIISAKVEGGRYPFIILTNSTEDCPLGYGFKLKYGEQKILKFPILQYAKDIYCLNKDRFETLRRFMDLTKYDEYTLYLKSERLIQEAINNLKDKKYSTAYIKAIDAWIYGQQAYLYSRKSIEDAAAVTPFFAFLILPFTFLAEKLFFNWQGYRKILSLLTIFTICVFSLYLLHPGLSLSASPANVIIGFSVLILSAPILLIIFSEAGSLLREMRMKTIGVHEIEVSRAGQAIYAFSAGIENMRKRKLRTGLILFTVIIMVSSVVSFTAISSFTIPISIPVPPEQGQPLYEGIYLHKYKWGHGGYSFSDQLVSYINVKYGNQSVILPRAWKYTIYPSTLAHYGSIGFTLIYNGKRLSFPPKVLLGLTPKEADITKLDMWLIGKSRWFLPGERLSCILTVSQAEELGIDPEALPVNITLEGLPFKVIGIIEEEMGLIKDLHEEITPIKRDFMIPEENLWIDHLSLDETLILPFETVIDMGGGVASISIIPVNRTSIRRIVDELYDIIKGPMIFYNIEGKIFLQRYGSSITVGGLETQIIPIVIVVLNIFNLVLASVHERRQEISIYSSVGLSPLHVAILFIAETVVYGIIGSIIAYLLALLEFKVLAPFILIETNYSSSMVIYSLGASILVVILSSLYPAYLSSRLVTPSLERAWRIRTKPVGDIWEIPLPFVANEDEAAGIINYLYEYLIQHELPDAAVFSVANLKVDKGSVKDKRFLRISANCRLAPYQVGVSQRIEIIALEEEKSRWSFKVSIRRLLGPVKEWERLNRGLIDQIRKQLILWRTLPDDEKAKYTKK